MAKGRTVPSTSFPIKEYLIRRKNTVFQISVQVDDESGNNDGGLSPLIAAAQAAVR
jgi:hypothetical protein